MANISTAPADFDAFAHITKETGSITCAVNRKINIGNFENIDVLCSVTLPIDLVGAEDMDDLKSMVEGVAREAFNMTSKETTERYELISGLTKT